MSSMKVTAFIRETSAKNNITDQAHVYFRVRDGKTDIKAVSELSINPNHWSAEQAGLQDACGSCSGGKAHGIRQSRADLTALISAQYYHGADSRWLKGVIEEFIILTSTSAKAEKVTNTVLCINASSMPRTTQWKRNSSGIMSITYVSCSTSSVFKGKSMRRARLHHAT